jgi:hypothetical protein
MLVSIFVRVKRPVTIDGVIFNVTPCPFEVEISELQSVIPVPPARAPPAPMEHVAGTAKALKLPLLWATAKVVPRTMRITANPSSASSLFIFFIPSEMMMQLT